MNAESPDSPTLSLDPDAPDDCQATRLFLTRRRHAILSLIHALGEICELLGLEEKIQANDRVREDLLRVKTTADRMANMIDKLVSPGQIGGDEAAKWLNHDLRGLLTIVIGYGDELCRKAGSHKLLGFHAEFDAIRDLGREALGVIDDTVKTLRSAPLVPPQVELESDEDFDTASEPGRILVAEDDGAIRELLCGYLRAQGHEVVAAHNGTEAIELLASEPFDLVLTDLVMPGADGFAVLKYLEADDKFNAVPAIIISGHGDMEDIARSIRLGAEDYLPKPFNRTILRARVGASLEKKRLRDRVELQRRRNDDLLRSILPNAVADELIQTDTVRPRRTARVAVLFADIVNFTAYCDLHRDEPERIVENLRHLFESWEDMAQECGVEKIKTIGDAFMAASGLLNHPVNPVLSCVRLGFRMIEFVRALRDGAGKSLGFDLRVGVHVGPVVSGLLGRRQSLFDLWGDTVNVASRLESHGKRGCVNLSAEAWQDLAGLIDGETRGTVHLKGKPEPVEIIHLNPAKIHWRTPN